MKTIPKLFLFVIFLGVLFLHTNCKRKAFEKVTVEGYVYDSIGGKPAPNAWVYLFANGPGEQEEDNVFVVGQAKTDASGYFYIHDNAAQSNLYGLVLNSSKAGGPFTTELNQYATQTFKLYLHY